MKKLILIISSLVAVVAFAEPAKKPADPKAAPAAAPAADAKKVAITGDAAKGAAKYKELCVSCHGETGKGDGVAAAALTPKPANFTDAAHAATVTDEYILNMIKEGGAANGKSPLMASWKAALKEDELQNVAAFVRSLSKTAAAPAAAEPKKDEKKPAKK
ncbi:MAG: cytochrome c [Archangiaceae bacterium]|nr:cytochrome c [Archangiaceae bacterium]